MPIPELAMGLASRGIRPLPCSIHCIVRCDSMPNVITGPVSSHAQWLMIHAGRQAHEHMVTCICVCYACHLCEEELSYACNMYCSPPWAIQFNENNALPRAQKQFVVGKWNSQGWANY